MTFEIEIAGRTRRISIERAAGPAGTYRVTVDGQRRQVDVRRVGEYGLSLLLERGTVPLPVPERGTVPLSREVVVAPGTVPGELLVSIGGRTVAATVNAGRTGATRDGGSHAHGEHVIAAPMPGRVVRVLVNPGDEVALRQGVVVVEAMKMENELRSPKAGRVKDVQVTVGTSVDAGRVLVVIE